MVDFNCRWEFLPDCILVELFSYLNWRELSIIAHTCRTWSRVSYDEQLWRAAFHKDWKVGRQTGLSPRAASWRQEYRRLVHETPRVLTDTITDHMDEVLHVSFAHDGELFASCSKDGYVKVWNSDHPVTIRYSQDMKEYKWMHTQFSQFNETDTLLLVSGILYGTQRLTGEIAVFSLEDKFELQCRVPNRPYDIFGCWYNDEYLISGNFHILGFHVSSSVLYLVRASQESDSEHKSVMAKLYQFYNTYYPMKCVMIANCVDDASTSSRTTKRKVNDVDGNDALIDFASCVRSSCFNVVREIGSEEKGNGDEEVGTVLDERDKYLIFSTGSKANVAHKIGFKRIRPLRFKERLSLNLKDKLAEYKQKEVENSTRELPNWHDEESVRGMFDEVDHYVELNGMIIGMALSPDHRYLYVNSRPWPAGCHISDPTDPPPIAQEIDIHVIDMITLQDVGLRFRSHKAYTPCESGFYLFLDVSDNYVASGAEDAKGYLWDRHYGMCLSRYQHDKVVNCVAFNPRDQEVLVTASDDQTLKVWRSKRAALRIRQNKQ